MYKYTKKNLLKDPEKYMYSEFHGSKFIDSYVSNRKDIMEKLNKNKFELSLDISDINLSELFISFIKNKKISKKSLVNLEIVKINDKENIDSKKLMKILIIKNIIKKNDNLEKTYVDFFVQRFEVSKKIYPFYDSINSKKGEGSNDLPLMYWLFSLLLTVVYLNSKNLKYLNCLLKVNDLICSLDEKLINKFPPESLSIILSQEIESVMSLSRKR